MICNGNGESVCCIFDGVVCPYLRENQGRRWACALMLEHGDWDKVLADPRYVRDVQPKYQRISKIHGVELNCRDWPPPGVSCDCS